MGFLTLSSDLDDEVSNLLFLSRRSRALVIAALQGPNWHYELPGI